MTTTRASGTFDVTLEARPPYDSRPGAILGQVTIEKTFMGDLTGTGSAQMLSAVTQTKGSAGYVAIERVVGALHGRSGSFVLQHSGTMRRGQAKLALSVVPDSGTGQLEGLTGEMSIEIVDGKHLYTLDYSIDL